MNTASTSGVSVAYSVWIGIGAVLTVAWAMLTGDEVFTPAKAVVLTVLIGCIVGLKFVKAPAEQPDASVAGGNPTTGRARP
ncbi:hypothetical protein DMP17_28775 [Pseudonocardia sp. TMWB2A]|uniref:DMT family transporter n=1 Tax=Pseudonocardia sp. TMWB2A TaxID=687430 RepID=UPI00307F9F68